MKATIKVTKDFTENFNTIIKRFKNDQVLVGIPEDDTARRGDKEKDAPTNAALFAVANFGSPANNIPAWPIMSIGIKNAQEDIAEQFKKTAVESLSKGFKALDTYYERAGIIASSEIKKVINEQIDVPENKPEKSTLNARKSKGTKYWLVTGQMRNAITYVVKGIK